MDPRNDHAMPMRPFARWSARPGALLTLVLVVTALRLVWLVFVSPYSLSEDEAHYWEWSRRLDLSYYSKGPGIAWTIWLGTRVIGDSVVGVRALAPVFGAVMALGVGVLGRRVFADGRVAFFGAALVLMIPAYQLSALLMTIDGPYLACWALAAVLAHRAIIGESRWAWAGLGLTLGVGFLYKYTIVLLPIGLVLFAIGHRRRLAPISIGRVASGVGLFVVCTLPVVIWNAREGFPTVRHLLGHLGLAAGDIPRPAGCAGREGVFGLRTLEYVGIQALIVGPAIGLVAIGIVRLWRTDRGNRDLGALLCVWMALPILGFYLLVTLLTEGEANWPIAGYLTLMPLAAREALRGMDRFLLLREDRTRHDRPGRVPGNASRGLWRAALIVGVGMGIGLVLLDPISKLAGVGGVARLDRVRRAPVLARRVRDELHRLREQTGLEPFIIGSHYGRVSLLAFELAGEGQTEILCASAVLPSFPDEGMCPGRRSQYDMWEQTDLRNPALIERLRGRPAVLLGARRKQWMAAFDDVSELFEDGWAQDRVSFVGYGFHGFD